MARGSVLPRRQCYAHVYMSIALMHQVGETEKPVVLIRKEGKHCNQQQLWIHSVYVSALLGSHGPAIQTTHVVAYSDWTVKKREKKIWTQQLPHHVHSSDTKAPAIIYQLWLRSDMLGGSVTLQLPRATFRSTTSPQEGTCSGNAVMCSGVSTYASGCSRQRSGYGSQCCAVQ
jgi:hypothetical protein